MGDIKVNLVDVGFALVAKFVVVVEALLAKADAAPAFHVNVFPFAIVAINTSPKLSSDQRPGSRVTLDADAASPQFPVLQDSNPQPYPYVCSAGPTLSKTFILKLPPVDTVPLALLDCVMVNVLVDGTVIT